MIPAFSINGITFDTGVAMSTDDLREAGFRRMPLWKRWIQRRPRHENIWHLANPRVQCFDGALEIYPCLDGYLDPDRRWETSCRIEVQDERIARIVIEVVDGVYAAGNFFERFLEAARSTFGEPATRHKREAGWDLPGRRVHARYDRHQYLAAFSLEDAELASLQGQA
jgi:hypothetical protein